jgi:hypothetical protein
MDLRRRSGSGAERSASPATACWAALSGRRRTAHIIDYPTRLKYLLCVAYAEFYVVPTFLNVIFQKIIANDVYNCLFAGDSKIQLFVGNAINGPQNYVRDFLDLKIFVASTRGYQSAFKDNDRMDKTHSFVLECAI